MHTTGVNFDAQRNVSVQELTIGLIRSTVLSLPYLAYLQKYSKTFMPLDDHYRQGIQAQPFTRIDVKGRALGICCDRFCITSQPQISTA